MMGAWLFQVEGVVRLAPGHLMVFNTALGLAVVGTALIVGAMFPAARSRVQAGAGLAAGALGALVVMQHFLGVSIGIDWPGLHRLVAETTGNRSPGRMAPATGVTFMLIGAVLLLGPRVRNVTQAMAVRIGTLAIVAVGVTTIVGYVLNFSEMFETYWLTQVSLITAVLFILLAGALWLSWRADPGNALRLIKSEDIRIALAGAHAISIACRYCGLLADADAHGRRSPGRIRD